MSRGRYLAVIGAAEIGEAQAIIAGRDLETIFTGDKLVVGADRQTPCTPLPIGSGVVVGDLYGHGAAKPDLQFGDEIRGADLVAHLSRTCWGSYVAFLDGPLIVARDPSGAMPAYYREAEGKMLVSNDVALLARSFAVDWGMLRLNIAAEGYHGRQTCLTDISELRPGMMLDGLPTAPMERAFWSPWDFCAPDRHAQIPKPGEIEAAIDHVVACLSSPFEQPLALVSGGLDSSIIVAGLAKAGSPAQCLTMATTDPSGDERSYARMVAEHFGFPLHEGFYDIGDVDLRRCVAPQLPHPKRRPFYQGMARIAQDTSVATGADAYFNGNGGDQVFCFLQSATPILDCVRARRPLLEILAAFENISLMTGCSLSEAVGSLWRRSRRPVRYRWPLTEDFLCAPTMLAIAEHPWLQCPAGALPGKAFHIAMIARMQEHMETPFQSDGPPMITPLMAQPLLEACLAIPSWKWISGGRNRSIIRDAFGERLPQKIINRKGKPGPESFSFQLLKAREHELREMLLDGLLASHDIIDREKIEAAFHALATQDGTQGRRLLQLADAEAWSRHWSGRKQAYPAQ